jgi:predicted RNA-binding protein associated with RNAse of E/G family
VLMLATPGAAHSVYAMRETGQTRLRCWYVDLQEPLRRTAIGFDTMDHLLDIVTSPDRSEWRWKDEDEFQEAVAIGVYSPEEARAIRAEGERVIELLRTGQPPFCDGWDRWSPPAEWKIPQLPDGWDRIIG